MELKLYSAIHVWIFLIKLILVEDVLRGGGAQVRVPDQCVHGGGLRRRRRRQVRHHAEHLVIPQGEIFEHWFNHKFINSVRM